ncbi:uncharacterized protein [Medicago truncatula]|uniref:uncharacterized protein isoform X3 n=1 Tax=Medicago truncatula TaxID=3880 RepID=UPI0019676A74|nr:uncharacterized protein LOC25500331 isoform X3 [Medicago truncatula]
MALILFLVLSLCITCCRVDARSKTLIDEQNQFTLSKSIMLFPTFAKNVVRSRSSYGKTTDDCPLGKVPIYNRTRSHQTITNSSSKLHIDDFRRYSQSSQRYHTVTLDTTQNMKIYGAYTGIVGYELSVQAQQYSLSAIWVESGSSSELNSIKVGAGVFPTLYGDNQLRITGQWTADGYNQTGCFNSNCPGFVQVNRDKEYALGSVISPPNSIGATQKLFAIFLIIQDRHSGHWWLYVENESKFVGYWPKDLFTHLKEGASLIRFGGQTYSPPNKNIPPMGSGRFPKEKFTNSSFMARLKIIDSQRNEIDVKPEDMKPYRDTSTNCYDLEYHGYEGPLYRQAFLYGGPGGPNCSK